MAKITKKEDELDIIMQSHLIEELQNNITKYLKEGEHEYNFKVLTHSLAYLIMHSTDVIFKKNHPEQKYKYIDDIASIASKMLRIRMNLEESTLQ